MKKNLLAALVASAVLLTGCDIYSPDVESLLSAPLLSDLQTHVDEALRDVVGQDIRLKYPLSGEYRSPYLFYDLDEDGEEEALVLYSLEEGAEELVYLQILDREDGVWRAGSALPGLGNEVDFVRFAHFLSDGSVTPVIGWRGENTDSNILAVYNVENHLMREVFSHHYSKLAFSDFGSGGTDRMLIAETGSPLSFSLIGEDSDHTLSVLDRAVSDHRLLYLSEPVVGLLEPDLPGAVFDGLVTSDNMASVLVGVRDGQIVLPQNASDGSSGGSVIVLGGDLFSRTFRANGARTCDIDGDGILEIPSSVPVPGYTGTLPSELAVQYFTRYSVCCGRDFKPGDIVYESRSGGFRFFLPEEWLPLYENGQLSVFYSPEDREFTFFLFEDTLSRRENELLRIRVVSSADHLASFDPEGSFLLAERGRFRYYAALPEDVPAGAPSLSEETVRANFDLLS